MENKTQNKELKIDVKVHRRILRFLNAARRPGDLMQRPIRDIPLYDGRLMEGVHEDESVKESKRIPLFDQELAKRVLQEKEKISPIYGFQHIRQLLEIEESGYHPRSSPNLIPWKKALVAEVFL